MRERAPLVIAETHHGFVCASAGVDHSNAPEPGTLVLLPVDPDASARRLRARLHELTGADVGVIVSDSFGRPFRQGTTDVAIGIAGVPAIVDLRGTTRSRRICAASRAVSRSPIRSPARPISLVARRKAFPSSSCAACELEGDGTAAGDRDRARARSLPLVGQTSLTTLASRGAYPRPATVRVVRWPTCPARRRRSPLATRPVPGQGAVTTCTYD